MIHDVRKGEHLAAIAVQHGFASYVTLWNAPENERLRARRDNPLVLLQGDAVAIPKQSPRAFRTQSSGEFTFVVHCEELVLRIKLLSLRGEPLSGRACTLRANGADHNLTTGSDGVVEVPIPNDARDGELTLDGIRYRLQIGGLEPVDEPSGQLQRLVALGYYHAAASSSENVGYAREERGDDRDDDPALQLAWELFQDEHGLTPTGEADEDSIAALEREYGL